MHTHSYAFAYAIKQTPYAFVAKIILCIYLLYDRRQCSIRIFFADFKKGFNLVDHNVVIDELQKLQVNPTITRWIKSFLSCSEQSVKIGSSTSTWKRANGGLPQGTKLGPFPFAVLVNSLFKDWSARIKFVDDTTALEVVSRCSPSLLPILVDEIAHFAPSRGMKLNCKKCKEMVISFLQYRLPQENPIYIDGVLVQIVSSFKLLGDSTTFSKHLRKVIWS